MTNSSGEITTYSQTLNQEGLKVSKLFLQGTLFFTIAANIGDVGLAAFDTACPDSLVAITPNKRVAKRWLAYELRRQKSAFENLATHNTQLNINLEKLRPYLLPVPPLAEQEAIAEALSDADALIESLKQLIAKKRQIKQGAMQELLRPKDGWVEKRLGKIAFVTKLAGFEYSNYFNSYKDGGEIIVIRGTNITQNSLDLSDVKTIPRSTSNKLARSQLNQGDLVFAYVGTIGPVYLVEENGKFHLGPNTCKIRAEKSISPEYLNAFFKTQMIAKEISEHTSIGAQPSLSMFKIRQFKINLPEDITEQTAIATILSDMDAEITALEAKLNKARQIKQGMMQELLTGRIRLI